MRSSVCSVLFVHWLGFALPAAPSDLEPSLEARLERIASAFRSGSARRLRASFATHGKLQVDLQDVEKAQGAFGPSQLEVIFEALFRDQRTRSFSFDVDDATLPTPDTAFARARWVRAPRERDEERTERLTFTLRREAEDWRILEIRSSR